MVLYECIMEETSLMRLDLRVPLVYEAAPGLLPFDCLPFGGKVSAEPEQLFCFELNPEQLGRIDPDMDQLLGALVFAGKGNGKQGTLELSAGHYLFTQQRRTLDREECIRVAVEQQKDGLWERLAPGDRLYVRYLFEDGSPVTQILRPYG